MNTIDFCFWLQGFFEISESNQLSEKQVEIIKNHLYLVFQHEIDPIRDKESPLSNKQAGILHNPNALPNDPLIRC